MWLQATERKKNEQDPNSTNNAGVVVHIYPARGIGRRVIIQGQSPAKTQDLI
jgi:hypothetical protein